MIKELPNYTIQFLPQYQLAFWSDPQRTKLNGPNKQGIYEAGKVPKKDLRT
jgi:hypothetical protein